MLSLPPLSSLLLFVRCSERRRRRGRRHPLHSHIRVRRETKRRQEKSGEFKICKTDGFLSVLFLSFFCCFGKSVCVRLIYVVVSLLPPPPPPRKILDRPDTFSSLSDKRSNTSFPSTPKKRKTFWAVFVAPGPCTEKEKTDTTQETKRRH